MKKFTLVPVGDCFEFQGEQYTKTGPLTAISLSNNKQRMIPRSALVKPMQGTDTPAQENRPTILEINRDSLREAFDHYHNGCLEWLRLAEKEMSEETVGQIRQALDTAHRRFLDDLGIN